MALREELGFPDGQNYDKGSFYLLFVTITLLIIVSLYESFILEVPTNHVLMGIGSFLLIFGVVLRAIGTCTLDKQFSLQVLEVREHELIKEGIYSKLRHPLYTGALLIAVSCVVFFNSFYGTLALVPVMAAGYYRIKIEEEFLIQKFGMSYENYMDRVKGLIPKVW